MVNYLLFNDHEHFVSQKLQSPSNIHPTLKKFVHGKFDFVFFCLRSKKWWNYYNDFMINEKTFSNWEIFKTIYFQRNGICDLV